MSDITAIIKDLREKMERATPGDWHNGDGVSCGFGIWNGEIHVADTDDMEKGCDDANFIAAAHNHLPALLDRLEELEAMQCKVIISEGAISEIKDD